MPDLQAVKKEPLQMCCDPFLETKKGIATANPSYVQWGFLLISYAFSISDLPAYTNFCRVFFGRQKKEQANFACSFPQIWKFCLERFPSFRYCMIYDCRTVMSFSSALSSSSFSAIFDIRPVFTSLTASSSLSYSMKRNAIFFAFFFRYSFADSEPNLL